MSSWYDSAGWVETRLGQRVSLLRPDPETISIFDIAHALSMQVRFNGHIASWWSVADHCLLVARMLPLELKLHGLLHDAAEAFISDLPRPLKRMKHLIGYRLVERRMERAISRRFGLPFKLPVEIKRADRLACFLERRDLMPDTRAPWPGELAIAGELARIPRIKHSDGPAFSRARFLTEFNSLIVARDFA